MIYLFGDYVININPICAFHYTNRWSWSGPNGYQMVRIHRQKLLENPVDFRVCVKLGHYVE